MPQALVVQFVNDLENRDYQAGVVIDVSAGLLDWLKSRKLVDDTPSVIAAAIAGGAQVVVHTAGPSAELQPVVVGADRVLRALDGRVVGSGGADGSRNRFIPAAAITQQSTGGAPSLIAADSVETWLPFWSMSGGTSGQSLLAITDSFPKPCNGLRVSALFTTATGDATKFEAWRLRTSQLLPGADINANTRNGPMVPFRTLATKVAQKRVLASYVPINPDHATVLRLFRENADPIDDWTGSTGVVGLSIEPLTVPDAVQVQSASGYNSWPFLFESAGRVICAYSRGVTHVLPDASRAVFARTSLDGGKTWGAERSIIPISGLDDSVTGKGEDSSGALLMWVRSGGLGTGRVHRLYRSVDGGETWSLLSSPTFAVNPLQITCIINVPTVGLLAFYHAGSYAAGASNNSWGVIRSSDNGVTWVQSQVEAGLTEQSWPTEIAGAYVGNGNILAIGRTEDVTTQAASRAQFQLQSADFGVTWTKAVTNITDIVRSTPTVIWDGANQRVSVYYFHRTWGALKRRTSALADVWGRPRDWSDSEAIGLGTLNGEDTGNANAVSLGGRHIVAYYSGAPGTTAVLVADVAA